jgi:RNA polymerase sigma-70 factor (ECF subfamily)
MPNASQKQRDRQWADRIRAGDREAFERLFRAYADALCTFAAQHVDDEALAEDLVQDVFCDLWDRREERWVRC